MGYLRGARPSVTEFGNGTCGQRILHNVGCGLGFEENLLECNHEFTTECSSCDQDSRVRCIEGAPPTNIMLSMRGESNVTITWNPPNSTLVMEHRLDLNGYIITCSSTDEDNQSIIIQAVLGPGRLNTTVTGLRLAGLDYECCVTADYNDYHPKNCLTINRTTISTDAPTESIIITPTETDTSTGQDSPTTISSPSVTAQDPLSLAVVNIVLGSVIALLVLLLVVAGVGLVYLQCVRSRGKDNSSVHMSHQCHMSQNSAYGQCHMSQNSSYGQCQQPSQENRHAAAAAGDNNSRPNDPSYEVISLVPRHQQDYEVV